MIWFGSRSWRLSGDLLVWILVGIGAPFGGATDAAAAGDVFVALARPNRAIPPFPALTAIAEVPAEPTDGEIRRYRRLEEPLVPVGKGPPRAAEGPALAAALNEFERTKESAALETFLSRFPESRWAPALQLNLGLGYRERGYFSKALQNWDLAWKGLREETQDAGHALADRAAAELAEQLARFGRRTELEALLLELAGRALLGSAGEKVARAREGLASMERHPERSFLCGPLALSRLRTALGMPLHPEVEAAESTALGTSLTEIGRLAEVSGMRVRKAKRRDGAPLALPCVVHWKVGHFGALLRQEQGRVLLQDLTFRHDQWLEAEAVDAEASGYFLTVGERLPTGYEPVDEAEGSRVFGRGNAAAGNSDHQGPFDPTVGGDGPCDKGMVTYTIHAMVLGFTLSDTPIGYDPPRGPPVRFTATYHQREANQPANFAFANLGRNWTFNWLSWLKVAPGPKGVARLYLPGGGIEEFVSEYTDDRDYAFTGDYLPNRDSGAVLIRRSDTDYERRLPDGSVYRFALPGQGDALFLTEVRDPIGQAVSVRYDAEFRIRALVDALGQVTTFRYEYSGDPWKITSVVDPFGREARFDYDAQGALLRITDVIGMASEFVGGAGVTGFKTPYGTTRFESQDDPRHHYRYLTVTDPLGGQEVAWFVGFNSNDQRPTLDESNFVPAGMNGNARDLGGRNTFFFNKKATAEGAHLARDASKARILHWMHAKDNQSCSHLLESEKPPLEARWFYNYGPDQQYAKDTTIRLARPTAIGRMTELGPAGSHDSQVVFRSFNRIGKIERVIDALGRSHRFDYATNEIDLEKVWRMGDAGWELLAQYTWNDRHQPLAATDTAGQVTRYEYYDRGQLRQILDPLGRRLSYSYDADGHLLRIEGPEPSVFTTFEYDGFGRMQSAGDAQGDRLRFDYDLLDRLQRVDYPDATYAYFGYDRLDNDKVRDRLGRWTRTRFNALRLPEEVVDSLDHTNRFGWCGCGSLESQTDAEGHRTVWNTDVLGRVRSRTYADGSQVVYDYESQTGRLQRVKDAKGQETHFRYFRDDSLSSISFSNTLVQTPSVAFYYGARAPRLERMVDGLGETKYSYHPILVPPKAGADRVASIDGPLANDLIHFGYDALGRLVHRVIAGADSRVDFDLLGRTTTLDNPLGHFDYGYEDSTDRLRTITYPSGQQTRLEYAGVQDDFRLTALTHRRPDGSVLTRHGLRYDVSGRLHSWSQASDGEPVRNQLMSYDAASRLHEVWDEDLEGRVFGTFVYSYDGNGNRVQEERGSWVSSGSINGIDQVTRLSAGGLLHLRGRLSEPSRVWVEGNPASVDPANEFRSALPVEAGTNRFEIVAIDRGENAVTNRFVVSVGGPPDTTMGYDANGNQTHRTSRSGSVTYEWDGADRLVAIQQDRERSEFYYDGFGRRVRITEKVGDSVVRDRWFVWVGAGLAEERDSEGKVVQRFFDHGFERQGTAFFYARDVRGSVREVTDGGGVLQTRYDYDPFGRRTRVSGSLETEFGFTGHFEHVPGGLWLTLHRVYDPDQGRWLSRDSAASLAGLSPYVYADNDPFSALDPTGDWAVLVLRTAPVIGGAIIGGALGSIHGGWEGMKEGALSGAVAGLVGPWSASGFRGAMIYGAAAGMAGGAAVQARRIILQGNCSSFEKVVEDLIGDGVIGAVTGGLGRGIHLRIDYMLDVRALRNVGVIARLRGQETEAVARMLNGLRNDLKLQYRALTPSQLVRVMERRNLKAYGDPVGPSAQWLREHGKSWQDIIDSSARSWGDSLLGR